MLAVTLGRLRAHWPNARLQVLTSVPALLRAYAPEAEPLADSRLPSLQSMSTVGRLVARLGPAAVGPGAVSLLRTREFVVGGLDRIRNRGGRGGVDEAGPAADGSAAGDGAAELPLHGNVAAAVRRASLVLAMGGGYLTDVDPGQTRRTLGVLERAIELGVPTAMAGQGIGPLSDPALVAPARRILPAVDVIGLREGSRGPGLLADLGVSADRVTVTGDDAIELAHGVRQSTLGADLGICLRVADYSPVADRAKTIVGRVIRDWAAEHDAALVPLIISEYRSEDRRSTLPLVHGHPRVISPLGRFVPAQAVAGRVSRCRVLVTGAYHLAVFALSQGIPVVGLSASTYYDDKLLGLAEMFGGGLSLIRLDDPALEARLHEAVRTLWAQAPVLRDGLRARAADQIRRSAALYERIFELVEKRADVA
jgi:polysaccharide pyruvyl transferase WcaK-like protein